MSMALPLLFFCSKEVDASESRRVSGLRLSSYNMCRGSRTYSMCALNKQLVICIQIYFLNEEKCPLRLQCYIGPTFYTLIYGLGQQSLEATAAGKNLPQSKWHFVFCRGSGE